MPDKIEAPGRAPRRTARTRWRQLLEHEMRRHEASLADAIEAVGPRGGKRPKPLKPE